MAMLLDSPIGSLLGKSDAEKALQPWWETIADFSVYGLIGIGFIVLPTALVNNEENPMKCTFCHKEQCVEGDANPEPVDVSSDKIVPDFDPDWVSAFCTETSVSKLVTYFPYVLIFMAFTILIVQKISDRIFDSNAKLDMFHNLLAELVLQGTAQTSGNESGLITAKIAKTCLQIRHSYEQSQNLHRSYLLKVLVCFVLATTFLIMVVMMVIPSLAGSPFVYCNVHGFMYECAGHPRVFYLYAGIGTAAIFAVFVMCSLFNLLWLAIPGCFCSLHKIMNKLLVRLRRKHGKKTPALKDEDILGQVLYKIYYGNKDLRLLLDLLASGSGLEYAFHVMTLFDEEFRDNLTADGIEVRPGLHDPHEVEVYVKENASALTSILNTFSSLDCVFMVDIMPSVAKRPVAVLNITIQDEDVLSESGHLEERRPLFYGRPNRQRLEQSVTFHGLRLDQIYKVRAATVMNGLQISYFEIDYKPQ